MEKKKIAWQRFKNTKFGRYLDLDDLIAVIFGVIGALFYVEGPIPYLEEWYNFYDRIHIDLMFLAATILGSANQYEAS
jgi:hypothetical protein